MGDSVSRKMMNAETEDEATVKRALADCIKESSRLFTELEESSKRWYYSSAPASTIKTPVDVSDALCKSEPVQVLVKLLCTPATSTTATTEASGKGGVIGGDQLSQLVTMLSDTLASEDSAKRRSGTAVFASVLEVALSHSRLLETSVSPVVSFFCDRIADKDCLFQVVRGLDAVLAVQDVSALYDDNEDTTKRCTVVARICRELFIVDVAALNPSLRLIILRILELLWDKYIAKGTVNDITLEEYGKGLARVTTGEREPKSILTMFRIFKEILSKAPVPAPSATAPNAPSPLHKELFEATSCYFPILFVPRATDPGAIKKPELSAALRATLAANIPSSEACLKLMIDKLSSSMEVVRGDACDALVDCCSSFGPQSVKPHMEGIWGGLRDNVVVSEDAELRSKGSLALSSIMSVFEDDTAVLKELLVPIAQDLTRLICSTGTDEQLALNACQMYSHLARSSRQTRVLLLELTAQQLCDAFKGFSSSATTSTDTTTPTEPAIKPVPKLPPHTIIKVLAEVCQACEGLSPAILHPFALPFYLLFTQSLELPSEIHKQHAVMGLGVLVGLYSKPAMPITIPLIEDEDEEEQSCSCEGCSAKSTCNGHCSHAMAETASASPVQAPAPTKNKKNKGGKKKNKKNKSKPKKPAHPQATQSTPEVTPTATSTTTSAAKESTPDVLMEELYQKVPPPPLNREQCVEAVKKIAAFLLPQAQINSKTAATFVEVLSGISRRDPTVIIEQVIPILFTSSSASTLSYMASLSSSHPTVFKVVADELCARLCDNPARNNQVIVIGSSTPSTTTSSTATTPSISVDEEVKLLDTLVQVIKDSVNNEEAVIYNTYSILPKLVTRAFEWVCVNDASQVDMRRHMVYGVAIMLQRVTFSMPFHIQLPLILTTTALFLSGGQSMFMQQTPFSPTIFDPNATTVPKEHYSLSKLFTAVVGSTDPSNIQLLSSAVPVLYECALKPLTPAQSTEATVEAAKCYAAILNKQLPTATSPMMLEPEAITTLLTTLSSSPQKYGSVMLLGWVCKALCLCWYAPYAQTALSALCDMCSLEATGASPDTPRWAAEALRIVAEPCDDALGTHTNANVTPSSGENVFLHVFERFVSQNTGAEVPVLNNNQLSALAYVVSSAPAPLLEKHAEKLLQLGIFSKMVGSQNDSLCKMGLQSLRALISAKSCHATLAKSLRPMFTSIAAVACSKVLVTGAGTGTSSAESGSNTWVAPVQVRVAALQVLSDMSLKMEPCHTLPFKAEVAALVTHVLDDPKRVVRHEARQCRNAWLVM